MLIAGGAGFIGSNLVQYWIDRTNDKVVNVDKLTYAGNLQSLCKVFNHSRHIFLRTDIGDTYAIPLILAKYKPRAIINLAAESHVDRSIHDPDIFIQTNVVATLKLLKAACSYWNELTDGDKTQFRFLHVSTDEVYGSLEPGAAPFRETTRYAPNSPYAASKAASDHLVRSYHHTFDLPTLTINCSNNYGPYQFPEKLIPLVVHRALAGEALPVYGDGKNIRDWLHVSDQCAAIQVVLEKGKPGEVYNIGASSEKTNLEVIELICSFLDEQQPRRDGKSYREQITFVKDRPGHDRRYAIDAGKIRRDLGWKPKQTFESGLRSTVSWYLENREWTASVTSGAYRDWIALHYDKHVHSA